MWNEKCNLNGGKSKQETREKEPIRIVNAASLNGLDPEQYHDGGYLTPEMAISVDTRALRGPECPRVCFGIPHAGEFVPSDLWDRMTLEGRKTVGITDRATGRIFSSELFPSVTTKMSRFIVDPNRPLRSSDEDSVPGGVLWKKGAFEGTDMYRDGEAPTDEEVFQYADGYYNAYYKHMLSVIGAVADRSEGGKVLVIDGHAFPISSDFHRYFQSYGVDDPQKLPMFIIGDGRGESCPDNIRQEFGKALKKHFSALSPQDQDNLRQYIKGDIVGYNDPFAGVHNVGFYGTHHDDFYALQLECNEAAYVEGNPIGEHFKCGRVDHRRVEIMQGIVEAACTDINELLKNLS